MAFKRKDRKKSDFISQSVKNMISSNGILADIMLGINPTKVPNSRTWKLVGKTADDTTYLCNVCNRIWEYKLESGKRKGADGSLIFHSSVPTYGKNNKVCTECED